MFLRDGESLPVCTRSRRDPISASKGYVNFLIPRGTVVKCEACDLPMSRGLPNTTFYGKHLRYEIYCSDLPATLFCE